MLEGVSTRLFGELVKPYLGYFDSIKIELRRAGIKASVQEYVSKMFFASFLVFAISLIVLSFFIAIPLPFFGYTYTLSIIIAFALGAVTFFVSYYYPTAKSANMRTQINRSLPFAAFYMTTISSSGVHPTEIFNVLSTRGGIIGNVAKKIYTNAKALGVNLTAAMQKEASITPSPDFADLLWGMASVITSGGDLQAYLQGKTEGLMAKYRRSLNDYSRQITLYTEIYITLVLVGSLFFIILMSIISPLTGTSILAVQTFLVFLFLPLVSIGFIVLLKSISPSE